MKHTTYMSIAEAIAKESKCVSWQVGAIIVKDGRIISTGYNGTPSKAKNCCDHSREMGWLQPIYDPTPPHINIFILNQDFRNEHSEWSKKNEIHAELNAIVFAAKNGVSIDGSSMYVTLSPCSECAKVIIQSGIKHIFYKTTYDKNGDDWCEILKINGIEVTQII